MAKGMAILAVALVVGATFAQPAAAQQGRTSPPSREAAMFEFLLAEVAAQRGDTGDALVAMGRLARELRDPLVARRAAELAIRGRALEPALDLAILLVELEPDSTLGRDLVASLVASRGDVEKARESLAAYVEASPVKPLLFSQLAFHYHGLSLAVPYNKGNDGIRRRLL